MKADDIYKGMQVIITSNKHSLTNRDIIGIIEKDPVSWTKVMVRYFDPNAGEPDEHGIINGDWVVKDFLSIHLEKPTPQECLRLARHYKKLALEFNELLKDLKGLSK